MPSVLFVCTANQFRSPIAAACFSKRIVELGWKSDWLVDSAGVWPVPGSPALPVANEVASQLGFSLEDHRSAVITPAQVSVSDLILVMETGHKEALQSEFSLFRSRIYLLTEVADNTSYEIPDPVADGPERCLEVGTQICQLIDKGFYRICNRAMREQRGLST
jgi:protein arginine phosphatase